MSRTVEEVSGGGHPFGMIDANTRTGKRGEGGGESVDKVLGTYGREHLNNNGERPLAFAAGQRLALLSKQTENPNVPYRAPCRALKPAIQATALITFSLDKRTVGSSAVRPFADRQRCDRDRYNLLMLRSAPVIVLKPIP